MRPFATDGDRHLGRLGKLAVRAADRRAQIAEGVPALNKDEDPASIVAEADVRRAARVGRPGRQLEDAGVPGSAAKPQAHYNFPPVRAIQVLTNRTWPPYSASAPAGCP